MSNYLDEKQLIAECISGKRNAQHQLFQRYAGKMMGVCMRYARHRQEAEDMMQDGFIRVFKYLDTFNHDSSLESWMRRVIVNASLRTVNKKSFSHELIGRDIPDKRLDQSDVVSELSAQEILSYLTLLPHGYRTVFNLFVVEGYSHREIGEQLDIGESTSRSQLAKARKMLQKIILEKQKIAV